MGDYFGKQENKALEFAELSGLPFVYTFTGGGCDAIYGETSSHRIYITDSQAGVPSAKEIHYVGVYLIDDDDLVGECWAADRGKLLEFVGRFSSLDELAAELVGGVVVDLGGACGDGY